jgi:DnaJ-class molecular chaperone
MLCPTCHGRRLFYFQGQLVPCPDCEGQGTIHCCDGLQEQTDQPASPADEDESNDDEPEA